MQSFEAWLRAREYADKTTEDSLTLLKQAQQLTAAGIDLPEHVRPAMVRWLAALAQDAVAPDSALQLAAEKIVHRDPAQRLGGKKRKVARRDAKSIDDAAWPLLVQKIEDDPSGAARVLEVMTRTGLRVGDVLRTEVSDLAASMKSGKIKLVLKGSNEVEDSIEGARSAWEHLHAACRTRRLSRGLVAQLAAPDSELGASPYGGARKACDRLLKKLALDVGIPEAIWTHRIRRTVGVQAYRVTEDMLAVRDLLHHKRVVTTEIYLSEARPDRAAELLQKVAARFAK